MEPAGLTVDVLAIAGLFNNAVDCFEYVQVSNPRVLGHTPIVKMTAERILTALELLHYVADDVLKPYRSEVLALSQRLTSIPASRDTLCAETSSTISTEDSQFRAKSQTTLGIGSARSIFNLFFDSGIIIQ